MGECVKVCENTWLRYYANGPSGSVFTWDVVGAASVDDHGTYIDVLWPLYSVGITGHITLHQSYSHCNGTADVDICIVQKPKASFTGPDEVCINDDVIFVNSSTFDPIMPIVSYYWDFGDGTGSSWTDAHHVYTVAGTYTVSLIATNECGCNDTLKKVITVNPNEGNKNECASIVCENETTTYGVQTDDCSSYTWTVQGGHIISDLTASKITVIWDDVASSPIPGYGIVTLFDACSHCPEPTQIKVPIILANPSIAGPDVICINEEAKYSLPLWPATRYMWGVIGFPSVFTGIKNDYFTTVKFTAPGEYLIHAWYENVISLCGANLYKTIKVLDAATISGPSLFCQNSAPTFTLSGGYTGDWVLIDQASNFTVATGSSSNSFTYSFSSAETFKLVATGDFCCKEFLITVSPIPDVVDHFDGENHVCLGRVYTYKAGKRIKAAL